MRCSNKADREKHEAKKSCDYSEEAPPVPIPNTVVKLLSADDTWGVTPWEIRTSQVFFLRPHGQAVKTSPFHGGNPGSSPGGVTTVVRNLMDPYDFLLISGCGGTGRHARFRFLCSGVKVRVLSSAP